MKKFTDIRNFLGEDNTDAYAVGSPGVQHGSNWAYSKKDSETKNNLQQAINKELNKSFMNPKTALAVLRSKINGIGLDFDLDPNAETSPGNLSFPLKRPNVFGKDLDTQIDKFVDDDGVTAYTLNIKIGQDEDGLYTIDGKIT